MKRNGLLPIYGAACFALTASCDDSRPAASETKPAGSGLENRRRSPDSESATQSSDRVSVHTRVDHLLKSLARLKPDEITVALKDRATLKLFMSLSPEDILR